MHVQLSDRWGGHRRRWWWSLAVAVTILLVIISAIIGTSIGGEKDAAAAPSSRLDGGAIKSSATGSATSPTTSATPNTKSGVGWPSSTAANKQAATTGGGGKVLPTPGPGPLVVVQPGPTAARPTSLAAALVQQSAAQQPPQQSGALKPAGNGTAPLVATTIDRQGDGSTTCLADTAFELHMAVLDPTCETILLLNNTQGAYDLRKDVVVSRSVVISGNPLTLPVINATLAVRAFNVTRGGYLELRHVRIRQGGGRIRARYGFEDAKPAQMVFEQRGGSILFGNESMGGQLVGVHFTAYALDQASINDAITATRNLVGVRIFGGDLLVLGGNIIIMYPLTDVLVIGNNILVIAGMLTMTGCTVTDFCMLISAFTVGATVAVLAGTALISLTHFTAAFAAMSGAGLGLEIFVGGGVMVMTGVTFNTLVALFGSYGFGSYLVAGGVLVMSGVTLDQVYPVVFTAGGGFYFAVGAGVLIETGVSIAQAIGVSYNAHNGGFNFVGAGVCIMTGVAQAITAGNNAFAGQGQETYLGAGYLSRIGVTTASCTGTNYFAGSGSSWAIAAGMTVQIGCPSYSVDGLYYFNGLGTIGFLGAGAAVIGDVSILGFNETELSPSATAMTLKQAAAAAAEEEEAQAAAVAAAEEQEAGNSDSTPSATLVAFDMVTPNLSWVSPSFMQAGRMMKDTSRRLRPPPPVGQAGQTHGGKEEEEEEEEEGRSDLFWVQGGLGNCTMCNAGLAFGPGSESCTTSDFCTQQQQDDHADSSSSSSNGTVEHTGYHTLSGQLTVTMPPGGQATWPTALTVRDALQAAVSGGDGREKTTTRTHTGMQVTVWDDTLPSGVSEATREDDRDQNQARRSTAANNEVPTAPAAGSSRAYSMAMVATSRDDTNYLIAGMQDDGSLLKALAAHLIDSGDLPHQAEVTSTCCQTIHAPSYDSPDFTKARVVGGTAATAGGVGEDEDGSKEVSSSAAGVITIVEQGPHESVSVSNVARRVTYLVQLDGFPPDVDLSITLVGGSSKQTSWVPSTTVLGQVTSDDKAGSAQLEWRVSPSLGLGQYYVRAAALSSSSSLLAMSPAFQVVDVPKRRKLGPRHFVPR